MMANFRTQQVAMEQEGCWGKKNWKELSVL